MTGEKIHHYIITRLVGEGGMASVYEAMHEKLQTRVAIKVLNPMLAANSNIRQRFENEARFMASLTHPNITRVIDYEERPGLLAIILEFLEGKDLNVLIKQKGPLEPREALTYFTQVLDAFDYAHNKGIVHRDVKPSNIFIEPSNVVKILDFGIAKLVGAGDDMTMTGTQMGTPVYMSPEQVNTDKTIDHRSDIYSLGVTLYYMLKGEPPYDTTTTSSFQIYTKIVHEPLPELGKYPEIEKVIRVATDKDRNLRYQTCKEFRNALLEAVQQKKAEPEKTVFVPPVDSEKTLIDIPEPVKKQPEPVQKKKEEKKPVPPKEKPIEKSAGSNKTRNMIITALGVLGILLFVVMKFFPSLVGGIFTGGVSDADRAKATRFLDLGIAQFKNPIMAGAYDSAVYYLTKGEKLDPENLDIQFYLGHALFRVDLVDTSDYRVLQYKMMSRSSDAFENIIRLDPEYKGNDTLNDQYSALTAIWGSLAWKYLVNNQNDSADIAFREGKKRGGFNDVSLEVARNILNSCDRDALLFMYYDIVYFPLLYIQYIENLRTDVKPISVPDVNRMWYFGYLRNSLKVPVSFGETWVGLMMDKTWETQLVSVENANTGQPFSWWVYGNTAGKMSTMDQVILDIITANKFSKPMHYCAIFDFSKGLLNLGQFLKPEGLVYKIKPEQGAEWYTTQQLKLHNLSFEVIKNSRLPSTNQRWVLDIIRNLYLQLSNTFYDKGDVVNAQLVKRMMEENIPVANYPFQIKDIETSYKTLINNLDYTDEQREQNEQAAIREYLQKNNLNGTPSATGLYYIETRAGSGPGAQNGNILKVHYTGKLLDGTVFDSSYDRNEPFEFELGAGNVIKGWEEGFWLRQAGSKGILIIPYNLGYGKSGSSNRIPGYSTLVFEVELLEIN
jgi:serine/threonine protein kinase/FKBP-type peptidyl-prolyl cis-trans isomerase